MTGSFVHLHVHTEYSMLDGTARIADVVAAACSDRQPAVGITDHGNMYGALDFYNACRAQAIKPIIGTEVYMVAEGRNDRPLGRGPVDRDTGAVGGTVSFHLTLLAETTEGYKNLMKLSSAACLDGDSHTPGCDWQLLETFHAGIIATTGCLDGLVPKALISGEVELATRRAARLQDVFGPDSLFVELQDHGLPTQSQINPRLVEIAQRIGAPLLATNDCHYTRRQDRLAHDALLCLQTGSRMDDPNRLKFEGGEYYLKSAAEMRQLFRELPVACDNTLRIAERASVQIDLPGHPLLPRYGVPEGFVTQGEYLRHLTFAGAEQRYGTRISANVVERLEFELGVIEDMDCSSYFLVVWDLIQHARDSGIGVGPGRGATAGSCVAYCLRIVDVDPLRYGLLFERFLNPNRRQMPDIDLDLDVRYRSEMIRYTAERYGSDQVAQIITFSTIKPRAAVLDAVRVLGYPSSLGDRVANAMPRLAMGRVTPLSACFEVDPRFEDSYDASSGIREMYAADPAVAQVVDVARGLEGLPRHDGIHASAVVVTNEPLIEYLPIQRKPEPRTRTEDAPIVSQYAMHAVEELGLLKLDFLGLRNLGVIDMTLELIRRTRGTRPDIDAIPMADQQTLEMLRHGDSIGVFQLESAPMRRLMRSVAPTSFDDVAALIALYRPGPMVANMHNDYADRKNGRSPIPCLHPDVDEIIADTHGLVLYQEQVMLLAHRLAGYTLAEADDLLKTLVRKAHAPLEAARGRFVDGWIGAGGEAAFGRRAFDLLSDTAGNAFSRSHAVSYGLIAYRTAWLKTHYGVEYFTAIARSLPD
nr:DNA polymerase III subunit alpha [Actinomycetota bacterium]